jgi:hypothetical protein
MEWNSVQMNLVITTAMKALSDTTPSHTLLQNGVAERMNKTIILKAHCMLSNAGTRIRLLG